MGKAYAHTNPSRRPGGDFYPSPRSLIWCATDIILAEFDRSLPVLEPCSGDGAVSDELVGFGFQVITNDLYRAPGARVTLAKPGDADGALVIEGAGEDYLVRCSTERQVITNPPFSQWDDFVTTAKMHADTVMMIGRLNYFGTNSRFESGIWSELKAVYCFNRYVDYRTPPRLDGHFHVGAMATAWFLWKRGHVNPPALYIVDVQPYATLGNFKE